MGTHKSDDYKLTAVEYYLTEDTTQEEVCRIFKCSARSLMRWVERFENNGDVKRNNRPPVAYKINKEQVKFLLDEIKKNKTITMDDLLVKSKDKFVDFDITPRHLSRVVRDNNITFENHKSKTRTSQAIWKRYRHQQTNKGFL